ASSIGGIKRREMIPHRYPVQLGASSEEIVGCGLLPAMARAPEGNRDLVQSFSAPFAPWVTRRGHRTSEVIFESIHQAQGGRVPKRGLCATLNEPARRLPLPERDRIIQRRAPCD